MKRMVKKGTIEEIFSKARFSSESNQYMVYYRDFEKIKEITLPKFIKESDNFQKIPASRIIMIKQNNTILFEKNSQQND
jgi:uncharacterized protein (UPF0248 family)